MHTHRCATAYISGTVCNMAVVRLLVLCCERFDEVAHMAVELSAQLIASEQPEIGKDGRGGLKGLVT